MRILATLAIVGTCAALLASCAGVPLPPAGEAAPRTSRPAPPPPPDFPPAAPAAGPVIPRGASHWVPVDWQELPGFQADNLDEAWQAWLQSCERPAPEVARLCPDVKRLVIASAQDRLAWMQERLQPYRIEPLQGLPDGLLTSYYEPVLDATRLPDASHAAPLYRPPAGLAARKPWFTRQEIDTLPQAQAALRGREIAWLADPLDVLVLQIQGSGRLRVTEPDGRVRNVRIAFAGSNEQPYRSVGGWLLQQGAVRDASWPGIKAWAQQNPQRVNEMLWSNPRYVFFREEPDSGAGPRGAQGVPLTAGRSVAIENGTLPWGTPLWLASPGPLVQLQRLVFAQDTGSAIVGPVRADYFAGSGAQAGELAGRLKQPLRLWVLWPR